MHFAGAGWHVAHVKAVAKGGDMSVANLRPVCPTCNADMGTKDLNEYLAEQQQVVMSPSKSQIGVRSEHTTHEVEAVLASYWGDVAEELAEGEQQNFTAAVMKLTHEHIAARFNIPFAQVETVNGKMFNHNTALGLRYPFLAKKRGAWLVSPPRSTLVEQYQMAKAIGGVVSPMCLRKRLADPSPVDGQSPTKKPQP